MLLKIPPQTFLPGSEIGPLTKMETLGGSTALSAVSALRDLNGNERRKTRFRADGAEKVKMLAPGWGKARENCRAARGGKGRRRRRPQYGPFAWGASQPFAHTKWRAGPPFLSTRHRGSLKAMHISTVTAFVLFQHEAVTSLPFCYPGRASAACLARHEAESQNSWTFSTPFRARR